MKTRRQCEERGMNRRDFVKLGMAAGAVSGLSGLGAADAAPETAEADTPFLGAPPMERVRIGFVGVGIMGTSHLRNLLRIEGVEIKAVCDVLEEKVERARDLVEAAGHARPEGYSRGEYDFVRLCAEEDLDLVYTATPWEWHVRVCVAAMEHGKHAATEVPAAVTLEECWQLVETAEKKRRHCVMMENCCYGRTEMTVLNMVRLGLLGDVIHTECGYLHDVRDLFLGIHPERKWFHPHAVNRDGSLYSTHGIGPVAQCMNINRGDRFDYLVSMSNNALGLAAHAREKLPADDPRRDLAFRSGDVNTTLLRTRNGHTMTVVYNCNNPRPYSRINLVQGLRGIVEGYPDRVYLESESAGHEWEPMEAYWGKYQPALWREVGETAAAYGHGGMDYLENLRLIQCLRQGLPLDMDVYDAAAWSAIAPLSEQSVVGGSAPVQVPDFTRGRWERRPVLEVPGGA